MTDRYVTLTFERAVAAPVETLWQAWVTPGARALWSAPSPDHEASPGTAAAVAAVALATAGSSARHAGSSTKGFVYCLVHSVWLGCRGWEGLA